MDSTAQTSKKPWIEALLALILIYLFLLSIDLLSSSFKLWGKPLANLLINLTADPLVALFIGIIATAIVQSSSFTTSLIVAMVSSGALPFSSAVPMVMGANIGTTITNTLISLAHVGRRNEFERAFAAATIHDFFNLLTVIVLFPIQYFFHIFDRIAIPLASLFYGLPGMSAIQSPLKPILEPAVGMFQSALFTIFNSSWTVALAGIVAGFATIFFALAGLVKILKSSVSGRIERILNTIFGRSALFILFVGTAVTAVIQSSSITTSLVVPLAGAGLLTLEQIFPFTLGANIGTTVTAILASLAGNTMGLAIAFTHLLFNILGVLIFYCTMPLRRIPLCLARTLAHRAAINRLWVIGYIAFIFFLIPLIIIGIKMLY